MASVDGLARAADHRLLAAVEIRDHYVAVDGLQNSFDLFQRREDGRHASVVRHRDFASFRGRGR